MEILTPAILQQARSAQESIMLSTVTITAPADGWELVDGIEVPKRGPVVYNGPGRIQVDSQRGGGSPAGGIPQQVVPYVGAVPWHVTTLTNGCILTVDAAEDPQIVAQQFRIFPVETNGLAVTARRFSAECVSDLRPTS